MLKVYCLGFGVCPDPKDARILGLLLTISRMIVLEDLLHRRFRVSGFRAYLEVHG